MNRVKVGFFSFVEVTDPSEHHAYNEWHQFDHMPEQFQIPGVVFGERWVSTPACTAARLASSDQLAPIHYMALYLMAEPVGPTLDQFQELGARLGALGRFHRQRHSHLSGAWHFLQADAARRVLVSPEVVPWRPAKGVYVIVEEPVGETPDKEAIDRWVQEVNTTQVPAMLDVPGVVGVWSFGLSPVYRRDNWSPGRARITVSWLDDDPLKVAESLGPVVARRWDDAPVRPLLAGPMEKVIPGSWTWFDPD